jgi:phage-related protein
MNLARPRLQTGEKPLHWVGSAKRDLLTLPIPVVSAVGYSLGLAQLGGTHPSAKAWKGQGAGVLELVEEYDGNAYRAIYTVRFRKAIYVLHVFQKKSPKGIATDRRDIAMVARRLRAAQDDYRRHYGGDGD